MTDLSIQSTPAPAVADHTWLAGDSLAFATAQSGTIEVSSLTSGTHFDATTKVVPAGLALAKSGDFLVPWEGAAEVQSVAITGTPTGGTFRLTFDGEQTATIAFDANAAAVQAALEALSNVEPGDIVVTGTNPTFTLTFGGKFAGQNVPQLTATSALTGGSSPTTTVTTSTGGGDADAGILAGFTAYPIALLQSGGSLSTVVVTAYLIDAAIIPARLPVAAQRVINRLTPTTGKFAFVA